MPNSLVGAGNKSCARSRIHGCQLEVWWDACKSRSLNNVIDSLRIGPVIVPIDSGSLILVTASIVCLKVQDA